MNARPLVLFAFALGCGSTDPVDTPDASALDSATPASALSGYCATASAFLDRCGDELDDCERAALAACSATADVQRDEFLEARTACGFPDECTSAENFDERLCVHEATQDVEPTAAQLTLAEALCTRCERGPDCLEDFFFRAPPSNDGSVTVSGIGASYFHFHDDMVEQLQRDCLPPMGAESCLPMFYRCIRAKIEAHQPASVTEACSSDGPMP